MRFLVRNDIHTAGLEAEGSDIQAINRLYWRGDERGPGDIFSCGFRRRDDTAQGWLNRQADFLNGSDSSDSESEEEGEGAQIQPNVGMGHMPPSAPLYRLQRQDIAPATAICVARHFDAACLFPPRTAQVQAPQKTVHVYAVFVENGFNTFALQTQNANNPQNSLAMRQQAQSALFAAEAASHDIPPLHVLGAVRVSRYWAGATWAAGADAKLKGGFVTNLNSRGCPNRAQLLMQAQAALPAHVGVRFQIYP